MTDSRMNPEVDRFLSSAKQWREELGRLRAIILDCGLTEEAKWRHPCHTFEGKNIVVVQGFKEYCALMFFQGALLHDPEGILISPTENVQAGRQIRFTTVREIAEMEGTLKAYIREAIEVEKAGLKVAHRKTAEYPVPEEFQTKLDELPALKAAFAALTPGRQRGYLLYFAGAKQSKTREARIDKHVQRILDGKGLDDR